MFTGIIEEKGSIGKITHGGTWSQLYIRCSKVLEDINIGDSIAVNGICLTVTGYDKGGFTADVMPETIRRTSLNRLSPGSHVNLERAMAAGGRFGGHIVSGHIDGTGTIRTIRPEGNAVLFTISADKSILRLIVEKGSVAIDGISLTVAGLGADDFTVSIIPHTIEETILSDKKAGDPVNLENDCIGKYVERLMSFDTDDRKDNKKASGITREFLMQNGF